MASALDLAPTFNLGYFAYSLECPVKHTPLKDAVVLTPCGHTISEVAANQIFKKMVCVGDSEGVEKPGPCPVPFCQRTVTAYFPNQLIRSLVTSNLNVIESAALPAISATVAADKEIDLDTIPFPGKGAKFVLAEGDWSLLAPRGEHVRLMGFKSDNKKSLFKEVQILGYEDGSIRIFLEINKKLIKEGCNYLLRCGIYLDSNDQDMGFYKTDRHDTKLLFKIIIKHNELPADKLDLIRQLVAKGDWRDVTPLRAGEHLSRPLPFNRCDLPPLENRGWLDFWR